MSAPAWARRLLERVAGASGGEDVVGDLEEGHGRRLQRHRPVVASLLTGIEALELAIALLRERASVRRARRNLGRGGVPSAGANRRGGPAGGISMLDIKLGVRMLVRHPGLTLVGGLGMAVAIALGAGSYAIISAAFDATLPFDEERRVVAIELWDSEINNQEPQILHDFGIWREELESVELLGAWRPVGRNLTTRHGAAGPVSIAEMTASGFRLAGVSPLLGRHLIPEDERPGGAPVVVIGYDAWQNRFFGDPDIVGETVRLGATYHTVVGVMPDGFGFPLYHEFWTPLRAAATPWGPRQGPEVFVFGRLAPGATADQARAELEFLGRRSASASPETHARLHPQLVPYTTQFLDDSGIRNARGWQVQVLQLPLLLLLGVICVNVAILVYARTVTRQGEIAVRTALGASRQRIVAQLFAEGLVLSGGAAMLGLVVAAAGLGQIERSLDAITFIPYWMNFGLSPGTVLYAAGLSVLAATVVGVLPALRATGRVQPSLRELGGGTGMRMGRTWTALIVGQVAIAVALLPPAAHFGEVFFRYGLADPGFPAEEYLTAWLVMDRPERSGEEGEDGDRGFSERLADRLVELDRRLEAEPSVAGVTFASAPEGGMRVRIEVEDLPLPAESSSGHLVGAHLVDLDYFGVFDLAVASGRTFHSGDLADSATTVVVNESFVNQLLGGANAVGRRIRYAKGYRAGGIERLPQGVRTEQWFEIVGVVADLQGRALEPDAPVAALYHARAPGQIHPASVAVHMRDAAPASFVSTFRNLTTAVDPTLQPREILPLDQVLDVEQRALRLSALAILIVMTSVLLLSAAGIHALMAFTVARRRREIGIRSALGAPPRSILAGVFRRTALQLSGGALAGLVVAGLLDRFSGGQMLGGRATLLLPAVALFMIAVGLLAALGPALGGLRIEPVEALRAD